MAEVGLGSSQANWGDADASRTSAETPRGKGLSSAETEQKLASVVANGITVSQPSSEKVAKHLKEVVITDANNQQTTVKIKDLAKELRVSSKYVKQAAAEGRLPEFTKDMQKALQSYESKFNHFEKENAKLVHQETGQKTGLSSKHLMTITAKAFFTLEKNQSTFMRPGFFKSQRLVTKEEGGGLAISKHVTLLGKGTFGKAKLFQTETLGKATVVKFARQKPAGKSSNRAGAVKDVKNEFVLTNEIGGQRGVQDKPHMVVNVLSKKGKVLEEGYMRPDYDGDGGRLFNDRQNPEITGEKALDVMHQVFCGLGVLQKKQIGHKDLKPANLLFRRTGDQIVLHLSDFGGAKKLDDLAPIENFFNPTYTPAYRCPQDRDQVKKLEKEYKNGEITEHQFREGYRELSEKWDVYSTAVSLYEILTGGILYDPKASPVNEELLAAGALLQASGQGELDMSGPFEGSRLTALNIPQNVVNLMEQSLHNDYTKRPSHEEFLVALEQASPQLASLRPTLIT